MAATRSTAPKNIFGNFSLIGTLGSSVTLGVAHCSHRYWSVAQDEPLHLGSVTLVEVPKECMMIFHGLLFHYGGRAKWDGFYFEESLRTFTYLHDKQWKMSTEALTHIARPSHTCTGCEKCDKVQKKLKEERCDGGDIMVWKSKLSPVDISAMNPGDEVMGHIMTLGWAIVKQFKHDDKDALDFLQEKRQIHAHFHQ